MTGLNTFRDAPTHSRLLKLLCQGLRYETMAHGLSTDLRRRKGQLSFTQMRKSDMK